MRARIRNVKPDIFHDEQLWALGATTGLPIYQGFQGLWCYADREGRFEWRPMALKSLITPYWDGDFEALLDALARAGMVVKYTVDGRVYGWVRNLKRHQKTNAREPESSLPAPPNYAPHDAAGATHEFDAAAHCDDAAAHCDDDDDDPPLHHDARAERRGIGIGIGDGIGNGVGVGDDDDAAEAAPPPPPKPVKRSKARARTPLPEHFMPTAGDDALAAELGVNLASEFPKFIDHHQAHGSLMADWPAALRKWIRNAHEWGRSGGNRQPSPDDRMQHQADRIAMLRQREAAEEARNN
jgi:hypothetical protein